MCSIGPSTSLETIFVPLVFNLRPTQDYLHLFNLISIIFQIAQVSQNWLEIPVQCTVMADAVYIVDAGSTGSRLYSALFIQVRGAQFSSIPVSSSRQAVSQYPPPNCPRLVLGCIEADFCKQILI